MGANVGTIKRSEEERRAHRAAKKIAREAKKNKGATRSANISVLDVSDLIEDNF